MSKTITVENILEFTFFDKYGKGWNPTDQNKWEDMRKDLEIDKVREKIGDNPTMYTRLSGNTKFDKAVVTYLEKNHKKNVIIIKE